MNFNITERKMSYFSTNPTVFSHPLGGWWEIGWFPLILWLFFLDRSSTLRAPGRFATAGVWVCVPEGMWPRSSVEAWAWLRHAAKTWPALTSCLHIPPSGNKVCVSSRMEKTLWKTRGREYDILAMLQPDSPNDTSISVGFSTPSLKVLL